MRISLIGPVYPYRGGIAHHTALLAKHLAERHDVQLISFRRQYPRWLFPGHSDRDPSMAPLRSDAIFLLDPLNPLTWWAVAQRVRAWRPDALILPWWVPFWAPPWLTLALLTHHWTRARVLFLCHNVLPHDGGWVGRFLTRLVLSSGDAIIVQAKEDLCNLNELIPGKEGVWTPHPTYAELGQRSDAGSAPSGPSATRARLGLPETASRTPLLLFFGFIRPYKGLNVLLEALPAIQAQMPVHLLAVGEIWGASEEYRAQIQRLGISDHVTLIDEYVPDEHLGRYFGAADVVVLPYVSATQSGVVQLAFGYGLPVIASRVGGLPDVVRHEETGLLVPPNDPVALAAAIVRFFRDDMGPWMRANIAADQACFSWQRMVETIELLLGVPN
jgi:glycosyltransferase involved in cell wall biosynthesis